jgi:hypothetical protein
MFDGTYNESEMTFWIGLFLLNKLDWLYMVITFGYSVFSFTFTVIWSLRMEAAFIFFALDDPFGWTDKREKCKELIHKNVSHTTKDEKLWQRQTLVHFRSTIESEKRKDSCHCVFLRSEKEVFLFAVRAFFSLPSKNKLLWLFKCNDENTPFVTDVAKYPVCFRHVKSEH